MEKNVFLPWFKRVTNERRHVNIMQNHGRLENKNIWKGWKWGKVYGILLSFHGEKTDKGCGSPPQCDMEEKMKLILMLWFWNGDKGDTLLNAGEL